MYPKVMVSLQIDRAIGPERYLFARSSNPGVGAIGTRARGEALAAVTPSPTAGHGVAAGVLTEPRVGVGRSPARRLGTAIQRLRRSYSPARRRHRRTGDAVRSAPTDLVAKPIRE